MRRSRWASTSACCGNTRTIASQERRSARSNCCRWRGSFSRSSTWASPNEPNSVPAYNWRKLKWRSGFRYGNRSSFSDHVGRLYLLFCASLALHRDLSTVSHTLLRSLSGSADDTLSYNYMARWFTPSSPSDRWRRWRWRWRQWTAASWWLH